MFYDWVCVNMSTIIINTTLLCVGAIFLFISFRNSWVLNTRRRWREHIKIYLECNLNQRLYYTNIHNIVATYDNMYMCFWIWNLRDFVEEENKKLFDEIMTYNKGD